MNWSIIDAFIQTSSSFFVKGGIVILIKITSLSGIEAVFKKRTHFCNKGGVESWLLVPQHIKDFSRIQDRFDASG